ncbi:peptidyl-prolyl cis-trans isomerase [Terrilactibacillus sp. S3-3]|nr:peptidyl-prolyl cis-trans isomerase [Terrilactibacillus sp. S3-3]
MHTILPLTGKVKFSITLDPSSWIFDDRKIEWNDFLEEAKNGSGDIMEDETKVYEREIKALSKKLGKPADGKHIRRYSKQQWLTDSFVIPARPFIDNAEPLEEAATVIFHQKNGERYSLPLEDVRKGVFCIFKRWKSDCR